ncbi:MAG: molybdenum cofactor guanylyltransferase [Cytophagaceae bacterium]
MYCGNPSNEIEKLACLLLCGGRSSRMGTDKSFVRLPSLGNATFFEISKRLIQSVGLQTYVSIREEQSNNYKSYSDVMFVFDSVSMDGPLNGVLSAYEKYPDYDWLILPVDMPFLTKEVLEYLMNEYLEGQYGHEVFVYETKDSFVQPLPGIYTKEMLRKIAWLHYSGQLQKNSFKQIIELSNIQTILSPESWSSFFRNVNSPQELEEK